MDRIILSLTKQKKTPCTMKNLKAQIKTKSNYQNLNGKFVNIIQFLGSVVYCEYINENGDSVRCDFGLNEIIQIKEIN